MKEIKEKTHKLSNGGTRAAANDSTGKARFFWTCFHKKLKVDEASLAKNSGTPEPASDPEPKCNLEGFCLEEVTCLICVEDGLFL